MVLFVIEVELRFTQPGKRFDMLVISIPKKQMGTRGEGDKMKAIYEASASD